MTGNVWSRRDFASRLSFLLGACGLLIVALTGVEAGAADYAISRVEVSSTEHEVILAVFAAADGPLEIQAFTLGDPPRLVLDLPAATLDPEQPACLPVGAAGIRQIRLGQFQFDPDIARLVLDLDEDAPAPAWRTVRGEEPGKTNLIFPVAGPVLLEAPEVEATEDAVMVRVAGVAQLPRCVAILDNPPRVFADITDAQLQASYRQELPDGLIREIRMAQQPAPSEHPVSRVVVELREAQYHSVFVDGDDLVVALGPRPWALPLADHEGANRMAGRRIVVDPGHGGEDIGAPAIFGPPPQGPYEKDIVLDIALRLSRLLEAEGAEVTLTRQGDSFISLRGRAEMANRLNADAFISIHCNSCDRPNTLCGSSVYYDHQHSVRFAQLVQEELVASLGTVDKGVRNANFAVIRRARVPGILVETAYINHDGDRGRLTHPIFRERAARAILRGAVRFLAEGSHEGGPRG